MTCTDECFACDFTFLGRGIFSVSEISSSSESNSFSDNDSDMPVRSTCIGSSRFCIDMKLIFSKSKNEDYSIHSPNLMVRKYIPRFRRPMTMMTTVDRLEHVQVLYKLFELNR